MTLPGPLVSAPVETPALYGMLTAARMLPMGEHEEAGLRYEALCDDPENLFPGACRPLLVPRQVTVTLAGQQTPGPPASYSITAAAVVDTGGPRQVSVAVGAGAPVTITTGTAAQPVYTGANPAGTVTVTVIDETTGAQQQVQTTQADDGSLSTTAIVLPLDDGVDPPPKTAGEPYGHTVAVPFAVYGVERCLVGYSEAEHEQRARARLAFIEETLVERAFALGWNGIGPALATSSPLVLSATTDPQPRPIPVDIATGVGLLEQWVDSTTPFIGFIHAPRRVAALCHRYNLAQPNGPQQQTKLGNPYVFGGGYPGTAPAGVPAPTVAPANPVWLYATRQVTVRRSEVFVPATATTGAFGYSTNKLFVVAERIYVLDFPCGTAAVLVDMAKPTGSGAS